MAEAWIQELTPPPDPARCCELLAALPCRIFLDSALREPRLGRYSFVAADPVLLIRSKGDRAEQVDPGTGAIQVVADPIAAVRDALAPFRADPVPDIPPFQGGAAGYVAYDFGRTLERLPLARHDDLAVPDVALGVYDWVLAWDHEKSRAWLVSTGLPEGNPARRRIRAEARARDVIGLLGGAAPSTTSRVAAMLITPRGGVVPSYAVSATDWDDTLDVRSTFSRDDYLGAVQRVRDYVYAGDIFQANLSQRFEAPLSGTAWSFYQRLRRRNAAPFGAFLDFPDALVASASPERFLRVDVSGHVETRPIKGTTPRGIGPEHDAHLGRALTESSKDQAENLMIVDLMRNDLSRVCRPGTVDVPELFALERYATVHHLVSTVVGELARGEDALSLLTAAFPGGSITGAPKVRAMEIIAELEPSERGVYCGSIGYRSVTGAMDTSIAIRTAVIRNSRVYFSAGGGIVADSEPAQEYRETLAKARGIIDALA